ncbi:MAG: hypothetical protein GEU93_11520 [Propionibacteriales bacterium]|nr:hypothetical protein [Propionibacteriales bacterium]
MRDGKAHTAEWKTQLQNGNKESADHDITPERSVRVVAFAQGPSLETAALHALLTSLPSIELAAIVTTYDELIPSIERHSPEIGLIVVQRADTMLFNLAHVLREHPGDARAVVVAETMASSQVQGLIELGVHGMFLAQISPQQLVAALRAIQLGQIVLDPMLMLGLNHQGRELSARQEQIIELLVRGAQNEVIARRLSISNSTLKRELKEVRAKLNVKDRTEIVSYAINAGFILW